MESSPSSSKPSSSMSPVIDSSPQQSSSQSYPSSNKMDQNTAKRLLREGATLIISEMPFGSEFGIDMNVFSVAEKFRGVKMIPIGLHFIYYSAVSKEKEIAPRTVFCHFFKRGELIVKKWNKFNEDIDDDDEKEKYEKSLSDGSLDKHLAAYQFDNYSIWIGLTDHISESLMKRLNPLCGKIKSVTELIPQQFRSSTMEIESEREESNDSDGLPNLKVEPNSVINFNAIPKRSLYPEGSSPSQISHHSIDATYTLQHMLSKYDHNCDILGEFQFAFVAFLVGQVYDAFEYWKRQLKLLCTCGDAIAKYNDLYLNFIRVLHFQLKEVPPDLFIDIVENDNFLLTYLRRFFTNIEQTVGIDESLKKRGRRFKDYLTNKFKWDFSGEIDDETPVIVDV